MSPVPRRDTAAGRAYNDLRNLAGREQRDPAELFTLYVLESFLARLAGSEYAGDFVLKGGVLMAAFAVRRPTRDIDLAAIKISNDVSNVEDRIRAIVATAREDGVSFDPGSVVGEAIRDAADYAGVRVHVTAQLATARIALHVDVNFGDPIWPAPTDPELPLLLGGTLRLRGYPAHMVLAEKIVTAIERGDQNSRWRDSSTSPQSAGIARSGTRSPEPLSKRSPGIGRSRSDRWSRSCVGCLILRNVGGQRGGASNVSTRRRRSTSGNCLPSARPSPTLSVSNRPGAAPGTRGPATGPSLPRGNNQLQVHSRSPRKHRRKVLPGGPAQSTAP